MLILAPLVTRNMMGNKGLHFSETHFSFDLKITHVSYTSAIPFRFCLPVILQYPWLRSYFPYFTNGTTCTSDS